MRDAAHILLVGNDGRLLNERAEVLFHFWPVAAISTFDEAATYIEWAHVLVLCHTVNEEQRASWIARSRVESAARPVVSIEFVDRTDLANLDAIRRDGADAVVAHEGGPAALVSTIYELATERGLPSKQWTCGGQTLLGADGLPESSQH